MGAGRGGGGGTEAAALPEWATGLGLIELEAGATTGLAFGLGRAAEEDDDGPPFFKSLPEVIGRAVPGFRLGIGFETLEAGSPLGTRTV